MRSMILALAGMAAAAALSGAPALADSYWDLEHARANARAGGPISEQDAELLERYGCLSGTKSAFCQKLEGRDRKAYRAERRRDKRDD
jgi:hypothetical protein